MLPLYFRNPIQMYPETTYTMVIGISGIAIAITTLATVIIVNTHDFSINPQDFLFYSKVLVGANIASLAVNLLLSFQTCLCNQRYLVQ